MGVVERLKLKYPILNQSDIEIEECILVEDENGVEYEPHLRYIFIRHPFVFNPTGLPLVFEGVRVWLNYFNHIPKEIKEIDYMSPYESWLTDEEIREYIDKNLESIILTFENSELTKEDCFVILTHTRNNYEGFSDWTVK
ncbi:MAG: hypothetical protein COB15_12130 [Flavobacteriales bacterium]|nr:MAG: hypothetical protein COB15_12130 [Flavobacteriales bacterium]